MSLKKGGCLIPTVIIIALMIIGFEYFTRHFFAVLAIVELCFLPALPYLYYKHEMNKLIDFVTKERISEYTNSLSELSSFIDTDSGYVEERIQSVEEGLNNLRNSLENKVDFYNEIEAHDEKICARQKQKKRKF